jgi:hypothetical protein
MEPTIVPPTEAHRTGLCQTKVPQAALESI